MKRKTEHKRREANPLGMIKIHPDLASRREFGPRLWAKNPDFIPTLDEVRRYFGPPKTFGGPPGQRESLRIAMDSAMDSCGGYTLIQHAFEMGQGAALGGQFMGYPALSGLTQNGFMDACISTVADDMTRNWIKLNRNAEGQESGDGEITLTDLEKKINGLDLQETFRRAATLTRYFGGCLIFIDTGERDPGRLKDPLNISSVSDELKNAEGLRFTVIEPINTFPGRYSSSDPLSPDYFMPATWWVLNREINASRLIHIHSGLPPVLLRPNYNFYGIPHAQILYDYILHFQENRDSANRLLNKFSLTAFKTDMGSILDGGSAANLESRMAYFAQKRNNDGVMVIDKEVEDIVKLETPLSGVTDIVKQSLEFVAAINRTPAVKLLGISPSGFNATGESDIRNYYDHIISQQEKELRHGIKKAVEVAEVFFFKQLDPNIDFDFNPLSEGDERVKSDVQKIKADTIAVYMDRGVVSQEEARARVAADPDSGFDDIEVENLPPLPDVVMYPDDPGIGFTEPPRVEEKSTEADPSPSEDIVLNGAQVTSMVTIVSQVAAGALPRESGLNMLLAAFPLTKQQAERILGEAGQGFVPAGTEGGEHGQAN